MDNLFKPNTLVLTANSRLTLALQNEADHHFQSHHKTVWETPLILPLQSWLTQQFHQHNQDGKILLTEMQEQCVWNNIIAQSTITPLLLHPDELAKLVKEAYAIFQLWQIPIDSLHAFQTQLEVNCLIEWFDAFQTKCLNENWIVSMQLPNFLLTHDQHKPLHLPKHIFLAGFDTQNPAIENLFAQFQDRSTIEHFEPCVTESITQQIILEDTETELITMAKWMKAQWKNNPHAKLGCIIHELNNLRASVERIMTTVFCNENILPTTEKQNPPFNISASLPLSAQGMIHVALQILMWCHQAVPIEEVALILQSPYLGKHKAQACQGAKIDAQLREQNRRWVVLEDLFYIENKSFSHWKILHTLAKEKENTLLKPSEWTQHFIALLKTAHWPGTQTQGSESFQILERFKKLLQSFSTLDLVFESIPYSQALQLLKTQCDNTLFQPKSHNEPIQIMGALESSGILFDAVWILGLHDGIWPQMAKPNPMIPYSLQQHYQTPHASADRELLFCTQVTKRFESCAKHVIFSSPKKNGEKLFFPSRLIAHLPIVSENALPQDDTKTITEINFQQSKKEWGYDEKAPALQADTTILGGSNILKLQSLCPFRAFASVRLIARALEKPTIGLSKKTKGILIHHILFEIWNTLKSQAGLLALSDDALKQLIEKIIDTALSDPIWQANRSENHAFFDIEKNRLQSLLFDWMQIEKSRPDFHVHALESSSDIIINQLPIKIRIDRIDQRTDGSLMLIDYKTGRMNLNDLLKENISEPQLPIYAVFHEQNKLFKAVAFARLHSADMGIAGIAEENQSFEKSNVSDITPIHKKKNEFHIDNWEALINTWKKTLLQLADDFCSGVARVQPIAPSVCEQCKMHALCRRAD